MDDPHDPPCVRCRRESKECYFSATRRKRKAEGEGSEPGEQDPIVDEYARRNRRKSMKADSPVSNVQPSAQQNRRSLTSRSFPATSTLNEYSLASEGSFQQPSPYGPDGPVDDGENGQDQEVANDTAAALFQSPINIPGDALHLLLKASGQSEDFHRRELESQRRRSTGQPALSPSSMPGNYPSAKTNVSHVGGKYKYQTNIDLATAEDSTGSGRTSISKEALDIWSRLRFVRAGWFTAREGISYMN